jgi:hypothetical protein
MQGTAYAVLTWADPRFPLNPSVDPMSLSSA